MQTDEQFELLSSHIHHPKLYIKYHFQVKIVIFIFCIKVMDDGTTNVIMQIHLLSVFVCFLIDFFFSFFLSNKCL